MKNVKQRELYDLMVKGERQEERDDERVQNFWHTSLSGCWYSMGAEKEYGNERELNSALTTL